MGIAETLNALLSIFIMIVPGFIFRRIGWLTEEHIKGLSAIVVNLTLPAMVLDAMQMPFSEAIFQSCIDLFLISFAGFLVAFLLSLALLKPLKLQRKQMSVLIFMLTFSNTGFVGMPVINALLGQEALLYASIIEAVSDVFLFTLGIAVMQIFSGEKVHIRMKEFINPGLICVTVGLILFVQEITLPGFLGTAVSLTGGATSLLAMTTLGALLGGVKFGEIFKDLKIYVVVVLRLGAIPLVMYLLLRVVMQNDSLMTTVAIIAFAMPAAVVSAIFAARYEADTEYGVKGVMLSTILCVFTIPIWALVLA